MLGIGEDGNDEPRKVKMPTLSALDALHPALSLFGT